MVQGDLDISQYENNGSDSDSSSEDVREDDDENEITLSSHNLVRYIFFDNLGNWNFTWPKIYARLTVVPFARIFI